MATNATLKAVQSIIREFTGQANVITIPRAMVRFMGDYEAAAAMAQLIYWTDRATDPDGWIYKTAKDWHDEVFLSPAQVRRVSKQLAARGIEMKFKKNRLHGSAPVWHYRLNWEIFADLFVQFLDSEQPRHSTNCNLDIEESAVTMEVEESATSLKGSTNLQHYPTSTNLPPTVASTAIGGGGSETTVSGGKRAATRPEAPSPNSAAPSPPLGCNPPDPATNTYDYLRQQGVSVKSATKFAHLDRNQIAAWWEAEILRDPAARKYEGRLVRKLEGNPAQFQAPPPPTPVDLPERPEWIDSPEEWAAMCRATPTMAANLAGSRWENGQLVGENDYMTEFYAKRGYAERITMARALQQGRAAA